MSDRSRAEKLTDDLIEAGYASVAELIKVAKAKIINKDDKDMDSELAAEKMKAAAAAKKLAIQDAFEILALVEEKEAIRDGEPLEKNTPAKEIGSNFAEKRAK